MRIDIVSLFPEFFDAFFSHSIIKRAIEAERLSMGVTNPRDFSHNKHGQVDDTPYGGGDGMLLMVEPLWNAVMHAKMIDPSAKVLIMTPRGVRWKQALASEYSEADHGYIFICGRYEGYDERIMALVDQEVSVGDYVLTGGELPAMTIIDSIVRLIPGVLGGAESATIESFADGETLEFPQYTRPVEWNGMEVPEVLLSGHHAEIAKWRAMQSKRSEN